METQTPFILKAFGAITAALGSAFGLGKYNANIVKKKELYHTDGTLIYMQQKDANKCKEDCLKMVSKASEETEKKFDKIIGYMKEQNDRHIKTTEFIGRVKQYMESDSKK